MTDFTKLKEIASQVRRDIVRMTNAVSSGHPGGSLGCTDFLTLLYFDWMNHNTDFSMEGINEDIFFLSNGHISPVFYSVLARSGYFPVKELATFRKLNTRLQGHPTTHEHLPGIRMASGSLGQGLSVALGAALGKKLNNDPGIIYSLHGDGELQEGQNWEAAMFGAHHKIDNVIATIDYNGQQIDGPLKEIMDLGDLEAKWKAFNWETYTMEGHDFADMKRVLTLAKENIGNGRPKVILMTTVMGQGVDFMAGTHHWHGKAPNEEQLKNALQQLPETLGDY